MDFSKQKTIAVDFDGTIVEDNYPAIGRPRTFAFDTLHRLQDQGHRLILWTYRVDHKLQEAVDFCKKNGIEFYAINKNYPEEEYNEQTPRKLHVDIFIDDRNIGGFPGWGKIYQLLMPNESLPEVLPKKKSFFGFGK
jgi:hydroxymethylpyrimidine pyrophosphatase-like HAD family hydrolase